MNGVIAKVGGNLKTYEGCIYSYDAQNRLTKAQKGNTLALFTYDGKNRQIMRSISVGGNTVVRFSVWDGWELVEEYSTTARTAAYVQGATGVIKSLLNNIYYYQDKLGSTTHIANAAGLMWQPIAGREPAGIKIDLLGELLELGSAKRGCVVLIYRTIQHTGHPQPVLSPPTGAFLLHSAPGGN